jgi:hypothetical protein
MAEERIARPVSPPVPEGETGRGTRSGVGPRAQPRVRKSRPVGRARPPAVVVGAAAPQAEALPSQAGAVPPDLGMETTEVAPSKARPRKAAAAAQKGRPPRAGATPPKPRPPKLEAAPRKARPRKGVAAVASEVAVPPEPVAVAAAPARGKRRTSRASEPPTPAVAGPEAVPPALGAATAEAPVSAAPVEARVEAPPPKAGPAGTPPAPVSVIQGPWPDWLRAQRRVLVAAAIGFVVGMITHAAMVPEETPPAPAPSKPATAQRYTPPRADTAPARPPAAGGAWDYRAAPPSQALPPGPGPGDYRPHGADVSRGETPWGGWARGEYAPPRGAGAQRGSSESQSPYEGRGNPWAQPADPGSYGGWPDGTYGRGDRAW